MRKYHHYGVPTDMSRFDEELVETENFRFYTTPFTTNKWRIQWHRFPEGHGLPQLITQVPHIAFLVDNLDEEIKHATVLLGPYSPILGYKVAFIDEQGIPIELVETTLSDEELGGLEKQQFKNQELKELN